MKRLAIVAALVVLAACSGGDSSSGTTTSTTLFTGMGFGGGVGNSGSSSSGSSGGSDGDATSGDSSGSGSGSVEEGYCATGTYELDGANLWEQVSAASPEGGRAEVLSGSVTLELRDDLTAELSMNSWTFRLFFPGQSDTVLATQNGGMSGTWAVDEDGVHTVSFGSDGITGTFLLETAQGSFPVPSGTETLVPLVDVEMFARCGVDVVVLPVVDQQLGATIEWVFDRE